MSSSQLIKDPPGITRSADGTLFWCGRRLIWFERGEMHADATAYALARDITEDEAEKEIVELVCEAVPYALIRRQHDR